MGDLSVKIKICDREYPMRVSPDEEAKIRKAGKLLYEKIKSYREQFGIDDKQDLLAMVAFDCLIESLGSESSQNNNNSKELADKIHYLNDLITEKI
jgi:cell division protein ZapA